MSTITCVLCQALLTFHPTSTEPLRFGYPFPEADIQRGLRLESRRGARLQWRRLQAGRDPVTKRVWVELCITGAGGPSRVKAGGIPATHGDAGRVVRRRIERHNETDRTVVTETWSWHGGERDQIRRTLFRAKAVHQDEVFLAGESTTSCSDRFLQRCLAAGISAKQWRRAGVLPGGGRLARRYREDLALLAEQLRELPGLRGRGDYGRSGGVITNLEFDTTLGLARLGLACEEAPLVQRAWRAAAHTVDIDLDARTGLWHRHGQDHRRGPPDPGHTWLGGLLLVGCVFADRHLIRNAGRVAEGLATHLTGRRRRSDRLRDHAWPLLAMEQWLRFANDRPVRRAANSVAARLQEQWDGINEVVVFGEGQRRSGVYEQRLWLTAGVLLPALRAHVARSGNQDIQARIEKLEARIRALVRNGKPGLPTHCWIRDGVILRVARSRRQARCFMVLEGISPRSLRRTLGRSNVRAALLETPARQDPDLATSFSIAARCAWIYRE